MHNKNRAIWKQIANINLDRACKKYKNKKHTYKNYHPVKSHGLILMDNSVTKRVVFLSSSLESSLEAVLKFSSVFLLIKSQNERSSSKNQLTERTVCGRATNRYGEWILTQFQELHEGILDINFWWDIKIFYIF